MAGLAYRIVVGLLALVLAENGLVGIPSSVGGQIAWLGGSGRHLVAPGLALILAFLFALVALGPERLRAWRQALAQNPAVRSDESTLTFSAATSAMFNCSRLSLAGGPTDHDEWLVIMPDFRITNHSDTPINIDVSLLVPVGKKGAPFWSEVREGEWRRSHTFHGEALAFYGPFLECPLAVGSHTTVRGKLGFMGPLLRGGNDFLVSHDSRLRIVDHLSGQDVQIPFSGGCYPNGELQN